MINIKCNGGDGEEQYLNLVEQVVGDLLDGLFDRLPGKAELAEFLLHEHPVSLPRLSNIKHDTCAHIIQTQSKLTSFLLCKNKTHQLISANFDNFYGYSISIELPPLSKLT